MDVRADAPTIDAGRDVDLDHAVQIADRVWWVGSVLPGDEFQSHVYLIEAGDNSVLLDPGSLLTIDETLRKVAEVVPLEHVRWVVAHHPDPDVCGALPMLRERLTNPDLTLVSQWRVFALTDHYRSGLPGYRVEEHDWRLPLGPGRELRFQLTPYLHFPGAIVTYDPGTGVLFSSDLFGGFVADPRRLYADDIDVAFEAVRPFHEHYMPSRELLAAALHRIRQRFPDITVIAPQHGHVLTGALVPEMFDRLSELECGIFRFAEEDADLARLLAVAETRRQVRQLLNTSRPNPEMFSMTRLLLRRVARIERVGLFVDLPDEGWWWFDSGTGVAGTAVGSQPEPSVNRVTIELNGNPPAVASITIEDGTTIDESVRALLMDLAVPMRLAADRLLHEREEALIRARLEAEARMDPLTGLLNRRGLLDALPAGPAAVILIDLDHFKTVNDTFGHDAGDNVLRRVAAAIRRTLRSHDVVARIGGEEILVVAPGADVAVGALAAERVRQAVADLDLSGVAPGGRITISAGVAVVAETADTPAFEAAMVAADQALYAAKGGGRNRVETAG